MIVTLRPDSSHSLARDLRRRAGITQRELAARVGKPQSMIARWERGHDEPRLDALVAIAHACGVELDISLRSRDEVDRAQIREHLRLTPAERLQNVEQVAAFRSTATRRR